MLFQVCCGIINENEGGEAEDDGVVADLSADRGAREDEAGSAAVPSRVADRRGAGLPRTANFPRPLHGLRNAGTPERGRIW